MARTWSTARSNYYYHMNALGVLSLLMMIQKGVATQFTVGGNNGWTVPSDNSALYNQWAEKRRFQVGDSLKFNYQSGSDSVLYVKKDDYNNCNTASPIQKFTDGPADFKLDKSGPYYFISGNKDNCQKNEKLVVVVLADRSKRVNDSAPPTASPPAPAPVTQLSPTSPPSPSIQETPAPSTQTTKEKNGAPSTVMQLSFAGALVGSSMILAF